MSGVRKQRPEDSGQIVEAGSGNAEVGKKKDRKQGVGKISYLLFVIGWDCSDLWCR